MTEVSRNVEELEELLYQYVKCFEDAHKIRKQIEKKNSLLNDADRKQFTDFLSSLKKGFEAIKKTKEVGELA